MEERGLGVCFPDNVGFILPGLPHTVRSPDVAFIRAERVPIAGFGHGFVPLAPDLVAEVLSPQETPAVVEERLRDYRDAGTRLVCVIDPESRTIAIHQADAAERRIVGTDTLDGAEIVPGFTIPVAQLFARVARQRPPEDM